MRRDAVQTALAERRCPAKLRAVLLAALRESRAGLSLPMPEYAATDKHDKRCLRYRCDGGGMPHQR